MLVDGRLKWRHSGRNELRFVSSPFGITHLSDTGHPHVILNLFQDRPLLRRLSGCPLTTDTLTPENRVQLE